MNRKFCLVLFLFVFTSVPVYARNPVKALFEHVAALHHKRWFQPIEHMALGAGIEISVSQLAGGQQKWPAGLYATALVAGFKEGSDAISGRDTKKSAAKDAAEILAGAGVAATARH